MKKYELVFSSKVENIEKVEALTERITREMNFPDEERDSIAIAVTEAVNNAIIHGNELEEGKKVHVEFSINTDILTIMVQDEGGGKGFDPDELPDPLDPENILKESGRGVFILKSLMDEVNFEFSQRGCKLTLIKSKLN